MPDVEPWVILYAVRYGLPRESYAHQEAIGLVMDFASDLRIWADTLVPDIRASEYNPITNIGCTNHACHLDHDQAITALTREEDGA